MTSTRSESPSPTGSQRPGGKPSSPSPCRCSSTRTGRWWWTSLKSLSLNSTTRWPQRRRPSDAENVQRPLLMLDFLPSTRLIGSLHIRSRRLPRWSLAQIWESPARRWHHRSHEIISRLWCHIVLQLLLAESFVVFLRRFQLLSIKSSSVGRVFFVVTETLKLLWTLSHVTTSWKLWKNKVSGSKLHLKLSDSVKVVRSLVHVQFSEDDLTPDRVSTWIESTQSANESVQVFVGVSQLQLFLLQSPSDRSEVKPVNSLKGRKPDVTQSAQLSVTVHLKPLWSVRESASANGFISFGFYGLSSFSLRIHETFHVSSWSHFRMKLLSRTSLHFLCHVQGGRSCCVLSFHLFTVVVRQVFLSLLRCFRLGRLLFDRHRSGYPAAHWIIFSTCSLLNKN